MAVNAHGYCVSPIYACVTKRFQHPGRFKKSRFFGTSHRALRNSSHMGCMVRCACLKCRHQQTQHNFNVKEVIMTTTLKALLFGSAIALTSLAVIEFAVATANPVVKLEPVVVTAKRLPVETDVIKLPTVLVTATKAQALAAAVEESSKQAAAELPSRL
jgi:hypothetical protein